MAREYTKSDVVEFLQEHFTMLLATASAASKPASSVMLYAIDDTACFYCATRRDSQKAKNMLENPQVSLSVWEHKKMLVQVDGVAREVNDAYSQEEVIGMLADAATRDPSFWPPVFRIRGGEYVVFTITPTWMRVLDLEQQTVRQEEQPFTVVDLTK